MAWALSTNPSGRRCGGGRSGDRRRAAEGDLDLAATAGAAAAPLLAGRARGVLQAVGVPLGHRTQRPPTLDGAARAAFIAKAEALARQYRTQLLGP
jgi:hypothetical protein